MTLKELKARVQVADEKAVAPKHRELLEMGANIVVKEIISNDVEITVFDNGYVLFTDGKRRTVFKLHECDGYDYSSVNGENTIFQSHCRGRIHMKRPFRKEEDSKNLLSAA